MRGFAFIPVLIAIVASAAVFGGGGYYVATNFNSNSQEQTATAAYSYTPVMEVETATSTEQATTTMQSKIETLHIPQQQKNTPASSVITPVTNIQQPGKDFRAECELSKEEVSVGHFFTAQLKIYYESKIGFDIAWDEKYFSKSISYDEASFKPTKVGKYILSAKVTRKSDGFSKIVNCESIKVIDPNASQTPAAPSLSPMEQACLEAKMEAVAISKQREEELLKHNATVAAIEKNSEGLYSNALNEEIREERNRYFEVDQYLIAKLTTTQTEINLYCE